MTDADYDYFEDYHAIRHLLPSLERYVTDFCPLGGFLRACLENNLADAAARADAQNFHLLGEIAKYMYNELPCTAWGSKEKVAAWLKERR